MLPKRRIATTVSAKMIRRRSAAFSNFGATKPGRDLKVMRANGDTSIMWQESANYLGLRLHESRDLLGTASRQLKPGQIESNRTSQGHPGRPVAKV